MTNNTFLNNLDDATNFKYTENGAITHDHLASDVYQMFALGAAYRTRSDDDCITLFKNAFEEDESLALKCLFYIRDVRGGAGERKFFRTCFRWLANEHPEAALRNLYNAVEMGRWDDLLYSCVDTPIEKDVLDMIVVQIGTDILSDAPSLCAKWMPSINASSLVTKRMGHKVRKAMGLSEKDYRKVLSKLRKRINVLERQISANEWGDVQYDKIPSQAGMKYRNAFERHDAERYAEFAKSKETKVNAGALYPVDIAHRAFYCCDNNYQSTERLMLQKYWDSLPDLYQGREENGIAVVDVSGSMTGIPMEAAISLGAYIAERGHGPFANHFITFSNTPRLVRFKGVDIVDKMQNCQAADWGMNTNIEAVFDLLLDTAKKASTKSEDMPTRLYILSDMEFDAGLKIREEAGVNTLLEGIAQKWKEEGYELPELIFWNLDCRNQNIPMLKGAKFSYISGFSPAIMDAILTGKSGYDLMIAKLVDSGRYNSVR
jgi:hypothetical protein